jgi:hypothetical protein
VSLVVIEAAELERRIEAAVRRVLAERTQPSACEWIGADEAANIVGVSREYLLKLRDVPRHGSRRAPRFLRTEIEAYTRGRAG